MALPELIGAREVTPADAAEAVVAAVRFELELLEGAIERAEQEADQLERLVASVTDVPSQDDGVVLRLSQFLDQHAAEAAARRRALLDQARAEADIRLELARDEAQLILLGGQRAPVLDAVTSPPELDFRAAEFPIDATVELLRELIESSSGSMPHLESLLGEQAPPPPTPNEPLAAPTSAVDVPDAETSSANVDPVSEGDVPDADERFQSFWDGRPEAEPEREPWWSLLPLDALLPMVALVLLLAVVLALIG